MDVDHRTSPGASLEIRPIASAEDLGRASRMLADAERQVGAPLVDESEQARLRAAVTDGALPAGGWVGWLAERDGRPVGYAALTGSGRGDVAAAPDVPGREEVLAALADRASTHASEQARDVVEVWLRHAAPDDVAAVEGAGARIERRLAVLGRDLAGVSAPEPPAGGTIRAFLAGEDDGAVVRVLAAAYAGTPDGGWTHDRFADKRELDWFDADDLLLGEQDGEVVALHWTKRRGGGIGEVYNLAVAPPGRGRGWGSALLGAGLVHLRERGCHEVILWVDRANPRAVRLYERSGFTTRWEDVALVLDDAG